GDEEGAERYMDLIDRFFMVWLKQDYQGLQKYTERLMADGHPLAEDFEELVEMGGGGSDPLDYLNGLGPEQYAEKRSQVGEALENLASKDPQAALEFFRSMPVGEPGVREGALKRLAEGWARNDGAAALTWARAIEQHGERVLALDHIIAELATQDVEAAARAFSETKELAALGGGRSRSMGMERILYEFAKNDAGRALQWLQATMGARIGNPSVLDPVIQFAPRDPSEFRAMLDGMEPSMIQTHLAMKMPIDYRGGAGEFVSQVAAMPDDDLRRYMLNTGLDQWMRQDPDGVKESIPNLPPEIRARVAARALAGGGAFDSVAEGVAFAQQTGADAASEPFASWMGARKDAADAADYFASLPPAADGAVPPAVSFLRGWATPSPEPARAWMEAQENDQALLAGGLVAGWLHADPEGASGWAGTMPEGEVRDVVAGSISAATIYSDPEASFAWGLSVGDEVKREQYLRSTLQHWYRSSPEATREALQFDGVPQVLRDAYLSE
ncbi:MAG: hypothetical protein ACR2RV_00025, partial [Verrucomicrobiales bacterium]